MGNREDLEAAAARLVRSKRFGRISARDLAAEAGSSPAAINYHFRTLDALLTTALVEAMQELGDDVDRAIAHAREAGAAERAAQEGFWDAVIDSARTRPELWWANFEALLEARDRPEVRELLAGATEHAAREIEGVLEPGPGSSSAGRMLDALMVGVVVQHLLDPERAPSTDDIVGWLTRTGTTDPAGPTGP